jgi:membrane fusion protein (multidrug efflux system)
METWLQQHRRHLLIGLPLVVAVIGFIAYLCGGRYIVTDDAYVEAPKIAISANVSGQVMHVYVHNNQYVQKNEPLFKLDDTPYKIAVEKAKAQLFNVELQIRALKATYRQRLANLEEAKHTLGYEQEEFNRQKKLAVNGIASQMTLNKANNYLQNAKQRYNAAEQALANTLASLNNNESIDITEHPRVKLAKANLNKAMLDLSYTVIKASMEGVVTKVEQLQPGDYVKAGDPVFTLISDKNIWIEANFRETDITHMLPGQLALITIDAFPNQKFTGEVMDLSPGTGSTFSLLPPENASGNWVKIVQRVPVRVSIDDKKIMLTAGLSAIVKVDTLHRRLYYKGKHK